MNDTIINKTASIQRCIKRAREEHHAAGDGFSSDHTRQDASILNITRACEQAIDLANHVVRQEKLGVPDESRGSFRLLASAGVIPSELADRLSKMIGFRNVAIHQYENLDRKILVAVITQDSEDLLTFSELILKRSATTVRNRGDM